MPGQTATYSNVSSYVNGITGIFIDLVGDTPASITASDFEFTVGNSSTPGTGSAPGWAGPLSPRSDRHGLRGQGIDGSDRIALSWPAGTIPASGCRSPSSRTPTRLALARRLLLRQRPGRHRNSTGDFRVNASDEIDAATTRTPSPTGRQLPIRTTSTATAS